MTKKRLTHMTVFEVLAEPTPRKPRTKSAMCNGTTFRSLRGKNLLVVEMKQLDPPEPIKHPRRRKKRK